MRTFHFIDLNSPGVVYVGTPAHIEGLRREGGHPLKLKGSFRVEFTSEGMFVVFSRGPKSLRRWDVRKAPSFWAWSDEQYDARINSE